MARNKLSDLNNHLFAQLERLGDEEMTPEQIKAEVQRSKAITEVAEKVIDNAKIVLEATKIAADNLPGKNKLPTLFITE